MDGSVLFSQDFSSNRSPFPELRASFRSGLVLRDAPSVLARLGSQLGGFPTSTGIPDMSWTLAEKNWSLSLSDGRLAAWLLDIGSSGGSWLMKHRIIDRAEAISFRGQGRAGWP